MKKVSVLLKHKKVKSANNKIKSKLSGTSSNTISSSERICKFTSLIRENKCALWKMKMELMVCFICILLGIFGSY